MRVFTEAARKQQRSARKAADEWMDLRATTMGRTEEQGRVLRAAALLSGARDPGSGGDAGDLIWSEMSSADQRAAEALGWGKQAWDAGKPAAACARPWDQLTVNEQICAATLGWNDQKWEKIGGRKKPKLRPMPEADPPPAASPAAAPEERDAPKEAWGTDLGGVDDLDPAASLAGKLRFVSLSVEPTGAELVKLFGESESQHLQALVQSEFTNLYAQWLADPVEQQAAAIAVAADGHGGAGAECAAQLRFFERLLQAAVDLLDEVVLMNEPRPDVVKGYVHCYHAWFADRIRDLCDRRTIVDGSGKSSSLPFADEMRTTLSLLRWVSQYEVQLVHYGVRDLRP